MTRRNDIAAQIRTALKTALGLNSRQVSVRNSRGGYETAIYVEIKDRTVALDDVERVAMAFRSVDRCPVTHEILSGGNVFVSVSYASNLFDDVIEFVSAELSAGESVGFGRDALHPLKINGKISEWECATARGERFAIGTAIRNLAARGVNVAECLEDAAADADAERAAMVAEIARLRAENVALYREINAALSA